MSLNHLTRFFQDINRGRSYFPDAAAVVDEIEEHIIKRIEDRMRTDLQPIVDKLNEVEANANAEHESVTTALTDIQAGIKKLQDEVAAGNPVTAADLQPLLDQATAIEATMTADKGAIDVEDAAAKAL